MATQTQVHLEAVPGCIHEQIFQSVYEQQRRRIQGLCLWMSSNPAEARQLAQSVFLEAWRQAESAAPAAPKLSSAPAPVLQGDRLVEVLASRFRGMFHNAADAAAPGPRLLPPAHAAFAPVRDALAALPLRLRLLYLLHDAEGYPAARVAAWLGLEPGACARMIHQARLRMRAACQAAA